PQRVQIVQRFELPSRVPEPVREGVELGNFGGVERSLDGHVGTTA
ncbi:MAG: hypothetical protein RLY56_1468, partial [Pseudomonadota bacterium]